jgi:hypothetical protein
VKELKSYMYGMIRDRKQEIKSGETSSTVRRDLFNQLITASLEEESAMEKTPGSQGLTDEELVGLVTFLTPLERLLRGIDACVVLMCVETPSFLLLLDTKPRLIRWLSLSATWRPTRRFRNGCSRS